jgi:5-methylcytosine-specific restriction enzyme A
MPILKRRNEPQPKRQGSNNREFYQSSRWHKLSKYFRHLNPLCNQCLKNGETKPAECVDHIVPIIEGGQMWNVNNLQSLCYSCHNRKTANENKTK